jgi:AcrR family transcriptional regulator
VKTLREQQRDFAASEIARRALALFLERGFDEVTVDEIAAAAGISPRTFFRYFPTKAHVLRDHQRFLFDRLTKALVDRPAREGPTTALRNAFLATAEMRAEDRARYVALGRMVVGDDITLAHAFAFETARIDELIAALVDRGATDDLELEVTVGAMLGAAQASFRYWVRHDGEPPLSELMQAAFRHVRFGRTR